MTLRPGVYIIKDGPLVVDKNASLTGVNVGFYFTGVRGGLLFDEKSTVSLTAPKNGPMSGLLFFEDRLAPPGLLSHLPHGGKVNAKATQCGLVARR